MQYYHSGMLYIIFYYTLFFIWTLTNEKIWNKQDKILFDNLLLKINPQTCAQYNLLECKHFLFKVPMHVDLEKRKYM